MLLRGFIALLLTLVAGLLLTSCSSSEPDVGAGGGGDAEGPARLLGPDEYATVLEEGERFVLNVHTPDEGQLAGTDAAIAFDELERREDELPTERTTSLAIYCMSGNMSRTAADTLSAMGYEDIVDLRGGMEAWRASGRDVVPSS